MDLWYNLWRSLNAYDVKDIRKRAEKMMQAQFDGLTIDDSNREGCITELMYQLSAVKTSAIIEIISAIRPTGFQPLDETYIRQKVVEQILKMYRNET